MVTLNVMLPLSSKWSKSPRPVWLQWLSLLWWAVWSTRWSNPSGKAKVRFFVTLLVVIFDGDDILMIIDCLIVVGAFLLDWERIIYLTSKTLPRLYWLWPYDAGNYIKLSAETDLIPGLACFLGCLFYELEMGIGLGVVIQVWHRLQSIGIVVSDTKVRRYWMLVISIHLNSVAMSWLK